jgi:hypothetical protein
MLLLLFISRGGSFIRGERDSSVIFSAVINIGFILDWLFNG